MKKLTYLNFFLLLSFLVCYPLFFVASASPVSISGETNHWKTYVNKKFGIAISYPPNLSPSPTFSEYYLLNNYWSAVDSGSMNQKNQFSVIEIPVYYFPKQSFLIYFTAIRIGVSKDPVDVGNCYGKNQSNLDSPARTHTIVTFNHQKFHTSIIEDAALGSYLHGISYRIKHKEACYAVEMIETGSYPDYFVADVRDSKKSIAMDKSIVQLRKNFKTLSDKIIRTFYLQ